MRVCVNRKPDKRRAPFSIEHAGGQTITKSYIARLFCQNGGKSGFEMCFGPSTLGAGAKTRLHMPKAVTYHEQYHTL